MSGIDIKLLSLGFRERDGVVTSAYFSLLTIGFRRLLGFEYWRQCEEEDGIDAWYWRIDITFRYFENFNKRP